MVLIIGQHDQGDDKHVLWSEIWKLTVTWISPGWLWKKKNQCNASCQVPRGVQVLSLARWGLLGIENNIWKLWLLWWWECDRLSVGIIAILRTPGGKRWEDDSWNHSIYHLGWFKVWFLFTTLFLVSVLVNAGANSRWEFVESNFEGVHYNHINLEILP